MTPFYTLRKVNTPVALTREMPVTCESSIPEKVSIILRKEKAAFAVVVTDPGAKSLNRNSSESVKYTANLWMFACVTNSVYCRLLQAHYSLVSVISHLGSTVNSGKC